jgi:hypothetical protein
MESWVLGLGVDTNLVDMGEGKQRACELRPGAYTILPVTSLKWQE